MRGRGMRGRGMRGMRGGAGVGGPGIGRPPPTTPRRGASNDAVTPRSIVPPPSSNNVSGSAGSGSEGSSPMSSPRVAPLPPPVVMPSPPSGATVPPPLSAAHVPSPLVVPPTQAAATSHSMSVADMSSVLSSSLEPMSQLQNAESDAQRMRASTSTAATTEAFPGVRSRQEKDVRREAKLARKEKERAEKRLRKEGKKRKNSSPMPVRHHDSRQPIGSSPLADSGGAGVGSAIVSPAGVSPPSGSSAMPAMSSIDSGVPMGDIVGARGVSGSTAQVINDLMRQKALIEALVMNRPTQCADVRNVSLEVFTSEISYLCSLHQMVLVAMPEAQRCFQKQRDAVFKLFGNVDELRTIHMSLATELVERYKQWCDTMCIGDVLLKYFRMCKPYYKYCAHHERASAYLVAEAKRKAMVQFCERVKETTGQPLPALLIVPVQRLPRYRYARATKAKQQQKKQRATNFCSFFFPEECCWKIC
jgi:RhoGEF domain